MALGRMFGVLILLLYVDLSVQDDAARAERLNVLEAKLTQLTQKVHELEAKEDKHTETISRLEKELSTLRGRNLKLEQKQSKSQKIIEKLEADVEEMKRMTLSDVGHKATLDSVALPRPMYKNLTQENNVATKIGSKTHRQGQRRIKLIPKMRRPEIKNEVKHDIDYVPSRKGSERSLSDELTQVAFSATITPHDYGPLGTGQIIRFDKVLTNIGNAYHAHSGIFTIPVDGTYVFSVTIAGWKHTTDHCYVQVRLNGNLISNLYTNTDDQSSHTIVLTLQTSDEIYMTNYVANDILLGATYSSFSGFLLYSAIVG